MNAACPACGSQFRPQRSTARYCGDACRKRASRKNRLPEAIRRPVAAFPRGKTHLATFPADVTLTTPSQIVGPPPTATQLHCSALPPAPLRTRTVGASPKKRVPRAHTLPADGQFGAVARGSDVVRLEVEG